MDPGAHSGNAPVTKPLEAPSFGGRHSLVRASSVSSERRHSQHLSVAEEVGVEPTRRFVSTSLVLKARRPTGDVALPKNLITKPLFDYLCVGNNPSVSVALGDVNTVKELE